MTDFVPLYVTLIILFIVGGILPFVMSEFTTHGIYSQDSIVSPVIYFLENGLTIDFPLIGEIDWFLFFFLPAFMREFIISQLVGFSYIPNPIAIPLLIICIVGVIYTVVKMLPTT